MSAVISQGLDVAEGLVVERPRRVQRNAERSAQQGPVGRGQVPNHRRFEIHMGRVVPPVMACWKLPGKEHVGVAE